MNLLILGGTQFLGRHMAQTLLEAGHGVTVFNRGRQATARAAMAARRDDGHPSGPIGEPPRRR
jgi:nucleoside-diphosphate-sugar epimerase